MALLMLDTFLESGPGKFVTRTRGESIFISNSRVVDEEMGFMVYSEYSQYSDFDNFLKGDGWREVSESVYTALSHVVRNLPAIHFGMHLDS